MKFNDYQAQAITTDAFIKPDKIDVTSMAFIEKLLGVSGEAGELADKIKKVIRDKDGKLTEEAKLEISKEIGDVLWYLSAIAHYLDIPLEDVAQANLDKLKSRQARGVLGGSGDNR